MVLETLIFLWITLAHELKYSYKFHLSCSCEWKTLPSLTFRYLKLLLPCLGGCDVTRGISDVILVSRRDCSHKCLMKDKALFSGPDIFWAAHGGKGFLKSHPFSIMARWKPSGIHESEVGYHIHISLCLLPAITRIQLCAVFHTLLRLWTFFLPSFIACCSLLPLILLWEPTGYSIAFYWTFIPFGR